MEHSEATDTMASARYLLGEMNAGERDAFEEHYFGCAECARDVRDGSSMIDAIRAERGVRNDRLKPLLTLGWIVAAAAIAGAVFLGLQNAELKKPRVVPTVSLLTIGTRGANEPATVAPSKPFAFYIDIPPQPSFPSYRIEIRDSSNETRVSVPVTAQEARDTVMVVVPQLQPGSYTVVIIGGDSANIGSAPLEVR